LPSVELHLAFTILALLCGAAFWLGDAFIAERAQIEDETSRFGPFDHPAFDKSYEARNAEREKLEAFARRFGKALTVMGAASGALLIVRVLF